MISPTLLIPFRQGIRIKANYAKNTKLHNLKEFFECQTQGFGGNEDIYKQFGLKGHNGLDFAYEEGTEVFASHDGHAFFTKDTSAGLGVIITGKNVKTIYWHLKSSHLPYLLSVPVKKGELIGFGDSTGFSTGHHLHFGLKLLDDNGQVLNRDNGYDGAVDPTPYLMMNMFEVVQVSGQKDVWLVRDGKRSLIYNADALLLISDFTDIKTVTQAELNALPDTGKVLASINQE